MLQIAVDSDGSVYVADGNYHQVLKYSFDDKSLVRWGSSDIGQSGSKPGEFNRPSGIAVSAGNVVYVSDTDNHRIQKMDPGDEFGEWEVTGIEKFGTLKDIAVDNSNEMVFVVEYIPHAVRQFSQQGELLKTLENPGNAFYIPDDVTVNKEGIAYVVYSNGHCIRKFNREGEIIDDEWSTLVNYKGEFYNPTGIDVDSGGNVYVADKRNHRIQKFDVNGEFCKAWGNYDATGSSDPESEKLEMLRGVAVDTEHNVYTVDEKTHTIYKFDSTGKLLKKWGGLSDETHPEDGKFYNPVGVAVSDDGVYVTDTDNHRVQKFYFDGRFTKWGRNNGDGTSGDGDGEFKRPHGIAVDSNGSVYVADRDNNRIQIFEPDGTFIKKIGPFPEFDNLLIYPIVIAADVDDKDEDDDCIYVLDCDNRVLKFSTDGVCIDSWGKDDAGDTTGSGDGEFRFPMGIAVDSQGYIYVVDSGNHRIQKFTSDGRFITKWGSNDGDGTSGEENGEFHDPYGIAVDSEGYVYITDTVNKRIQIFSIKNK